MKRNSLALITILALCFIAIPALAENEPALLSEYWTEGSAAAESLNARQITYVVESHLCTRTCIS